MEKVFGPMWGYYLACYTVAVPEGFVGYAKVCEHPPESTWTARWRCQGRSGTSGRRRFNSKPVSLSANLTRANVRHSS